MRNDHYKTLGVGKTATPAEIKKAYFALSLKYHPDRLVDATEEEKIKQKEAFQNISEAYSTLSSEESKRHYDASKMMHDFGFDEDFQSAGALHFKAKPLSYYEKQSWAHFKSVTLPLKQKQQDSTTIKVADLLTSTANETAMPELPKTLDVISALQLFMSFLNGEFQGVSHLRLKAYWNEQIEILSKTRQGSEELQLMGAICAIIESKDGCDMQIFAKRIIALAQLLQTNSFVEGETFKKHNLALWEHPKFRALLNVAAQFYVLKTPLPGIEHLARFTRSTLDETLSIDIIGLMPRSLHQVFGMQKRFQKLAADQNPEGLRDLAYFCIDCLAIVGFPEVRVNLMLKASWLFQMASLQAVDVATQVADEMMAMKLSIQAMRFSTKAVFNELYVLQHLLRLRNNQKYEHQQEKFWELLTADFMAKFGQYPFVYNLVSDLDKISEGLANANFMTHYINEILQILEDNDYQIDPEKRKSTHYKPLDVYNMAYTAALDGWYEASPATLEKFRLKTLELLLEERKLSLFAIERNVSNLFVMTTRNHLGWLEPNMGYDFVPNSTIYRELKGLEIDAQTGEIKFTLLPCKANESWNQKIFADYEVAEMLSQNIAGSSFSLDMLSPKYPHAPLQAMNYSPASIRGTAYLQAQLMADWLLKFFTTGQEIRGTYPYDVRSIEHAVSGLPAHLKSIVTDYHQNQIRKKGKVHRFWIEGCEVFATKQSTEDDLGLEKTNITFTKVQMRVKQHRMKYDLQGNLVDRDDSHEGFALYYLTQAEFDKKMATELPEYSIFIIKDADKVVVYEDEIRTMKTFSKSAITQYLTELNAQKYDNEFKILATNYDPEKSSEDNSNLVYRVISAIAKAAAVHHRFTAERVFAEEMTAHYDEFAEHFPVLRRLEQFTRIAAVMRELNASRFTCTASLTHYNKIINDSQHWISFTNKIEPGIKNEILQLVTSSVSQIRSLAPQKAAAAISGMQNRIGTLNFTIYSPEVVNLYETHVKQDIIQKHGLAAYNAWEPANKPTFLAQFATDLTNGKRTNIRPQLTTIFADLNYAGTLSSAIDQFMNGNNQQLIQLQTDDIIRHNISSLVADFSCPQHMCASVLSGNYQLIVDFAAHYKVTQIVAQNKALITQKIAKLQILEQAFASIGLGPISKAERCTELVPAVVVRSAEEGLVYGGVSINPSISFGLEAQRISQSLSSASGTGLSFAIHSAKQFVTDARKMASAVLLSASSLVSSSSYASTSLITELTISSVESDVRAAECKQRQLEFEQFNSRISFAQNMQKNFMQQVQPPRTTEKPSSSSSNDYGFGFSETIDKQGLATTAASGTSTGGYQYFKSDTAYCMYLKSMLNEMLDPSPSLDGIDGKLNWVAPLYSAHQIPQLTKKLKRNCEKTPSSPNAPEERTIFDPTPAELGGFIKAGVKFPGELLRSLENQLIKGRVKDLQLQQDLYKAMEGRKR